MTNAMMNRYELQQTLTNGVATVTFRKADGNLRTMRCTLQQSELPHQSGQFLSEVEGETNEEVLTVWDIENNGWRRFRIDSIKQIIVG